ncbi:MAG TPA: transcriptional repressor [Acidobacteriota bacterium]|nr:transcriptional repressor [Acidobacteriota bacterium]
MSKQKQIIYDLVCSTMTHPTADWIYQQARRKMAHISLGTVYRNLKALTNEGRLQEITTTKGPSRYDANVTRHSHLRCVECDRLEDLPEKDIRVEPKSQRIQQYKIIEHRIELMGLCPECQTKNQNAL